MFGGIDLDSLHIAVGTRGDANLDGEVNVLDVLKIANCILGMDCDLWWPYYNMADCNGDYTINILDALNIAKVILGIIPKCPG
jgi:hypothetical protein